MKRHLLICLALATLAIFTIAMLATQSERTKGKKNGFTRNFDAQQLFMVKKIKTPFSIDRYSLKWKDKLLFLGRDKRQILIIDSMLTNYRHFDIPHNSYLNLTSSQSEFFQDSTLSFISGTTQTIASFRLFDSVLTNFKIKTNHFTKSVLVSPHELIVRGFDDSMRSQLFKKIDPTTGLVTSEKKLFITKDDAGISTDGILRYDRQNDLLIYLFYHQNKYICFNRNLDLVSSGHTVDTNFTNKVTTELFTNKGSDIGKLASTKPMPPANFDCVANAGKLYVRSRLIADNETKKDWQHNSVVDEYTLLTGRYLGSFYIPHEAGSAVRNFIIFNNTLLATYNNHLILYRMK